MSNPLTAEALWTIPRVGAPSVAGGRIVVPVTTADIEVNTTATTLWELHSDGSPPRRLTTASASRPALSPDGSRLAFVRKVDDRPQIHVMPMDGGEPTALTDLPLGAIGAKWFPSGDALAVLALVFADHPDIGDSRMERDRRAEQNHSAKVSDRAVYRYWDRWLDGGEVPHIFKVGVDGGHATDLTPESGRWMRWDNTSDPLDDLDISPDGRIVAWCADRSRFPHGEIRWCLFTTDVETLEEHSLTPDHEGHASHPRFDPAGGAIVYGRTDDPHFYADRVHLIRHDLGSGSETDLTPSWDRSPTNWLFDGTDLVIEAEDDARQSLWRLTEDGAIGEVAREGTISGTSRLGPHSYVAVRSTIVTPPEIVMVGDGTVDPLSDFTVRSLAEFDLPTVSEVRFTGAADREIQMWVVTPKDAPAMPGPLVHMIHGGPHGAWTDVWHWRWNPAVFCGSSRRAALVNFHGSTSWGQEFAASIRGEWGDRPTADIESATDRLIADGIADPERIAITGGSYGGYLVSWLVGQTDRYACAVAHAAVTDLPNMYASDVTAGRADAYGAEVWTDLERVNRWSPAAHAGGYSTPTLVIHGERDYRVPVGQGLEFYGVLKAKGVDARLVYYPDENHWILTPANSIHWYGEVTGWIARFTE